MEYGGRTSYGDPSTIKPRGDRVLVKTIPEEVTHAGIVIPQNIAEGRPERAEVLAVGDGARHPKTGEVIPVDIEVGDIVIFHRHAGTHIGGFSDDYIIFNEKDILATVTETD
jgi:chaperonin GroES